MNVVHCIGRLLTVTVIWKTCDSEDDYRTGFEMQRAKKVVSNSPGLVNFAIGLVMFVLNLPDGQVLFWGKFKLEKDSNQSC